MGEDETDRERIKYLHARLLADETGITEAQARDLIEMIGIDHASLVREARRLKSSQKPAEKPRGSAR
ncbi:hypothetical protein RQ479_08520 [Mesorhizobium sp. ISC25]|uniref:hypothetical protein n=1 Tax=Mesorhizobium sp. ISC25 TaxID=3077335 RepID=UPI0035D9799C